MNKYRAKKVRIDGYTFDSKAEAARYVELARLESAGEIANLRVHPWFKLWGARDLVAPLVFPILIRSKGYPNGRQATYEADFEYVTTGANPKRIIEDVKGQDLPLGRLKRAIFEACYGIQVTIVKARR